MKKIGFIFLITLMVVACGSSGNGNNSLPEAVQPADVDLRDDSPRGDATPEPGLPPTWTPAPQAGQGHIFDLREQEIQITGTRSIYVVQRGDTLGEIATRFGVSLTDLARINNIDNWDIIEVGDELIIP
ncbi:MAG: LysM peptidoglycan-binding domain-containing protein [Chloroflexota bacterium]